MELQYDPRTKQQLKDLLYAYIYTPVERKLQARLADLIERNAAVLQSPHLSFIYRGKTYSIDPKGIPRKMNRLVPSLHGEMDDYLNDIRELNEQEIPFVLGFITQVLNASNDLQDYLRILPESVHQPLEELIAACGCRTTKLSQETVEELKEKNRQSIDLLKGRLVRNLLE